MCQIDVQSKVSRVCIILVAMMVLPMALCAATYYVTPGGTRTSGASTLDNWSTSNCYGTIISAIMQMSGGDEVVVNQGTYTGVANSIGRPSQAISQVLIPNGSAGAYTKVRARYPLDRDRPTIVDSGQDTDSEWDVWGRHIYVSGGQYIEVDGFFINARDNSDYLAVDITGESNHVKIRRCSLRRSITTDGNQSASLFQITGRSSYNLIEDCSLSGHYRYGFVVMGYGNDTDDTRSHHNIFRRCVARGDYVAGGEPFAPFAIYGHNNSAALGPHDNMFQNCIAIDGNNSIGATNTYKHSPWYIFKGQNSVTLTGCITLNNAVPFYYFFRTDYSGNNLSIINSVFAANIDTDATIDTAYWRGSGTTSGTDILSRCTFYGQPRGFSWNGTTTNGYIRNNLFVNLSNSAITFTGSYPTRSNNSFGSSSQAFGSSNVAYGSDLYYLVRVEQGSNRFGGGYNTEHVGAHIIFKHGTDGSLWGEQGWNTETAQLLWPWPYEDAIAYWFSQTNNPPSGASPATNNVTRGFCAANTSLTKYIWEYLGYQAPDDYSAGVAQDSVTNDTPDTTPPASPSGVSVQPID